MLQRDQFRSDMEQLRRSQAMFREKNRREIEEENERIAAYLKEREEKSQQLRDIEQEKRKKDEELRDRMCSELNGIEVCNIFVHVHSVFLHISCFHACRRQSESYTAIQIMSLKFYCRSQLASTCAHVISILHWSLHAYTYTYIHIVCIYVNLIYY